MTDRTYAIVAGLAWAIAAWLFIVALFSIGFIGPRIILEWDDENGERVDAVADPWEVRRVTPQGVR